MAFTFPVATGAFAQESAKTFGYYTNANTSGFPDARMPVVNPGSVSGFSPAGDLCANIYVFISNPIKATGLLGAWITHVNATTSGLFSVSETNFFRAPCRPQN
jgi:hypothetical protein